MPRYAKCTVTLSEAMTEVATVNWTTVAGTAVSPSDFVASSGTLTFAIGETEKIIKVRVRSNDQTIEERFTIVLSNPVNCKIADNSGLAILPGVTTPSLPIVSASNVTI